MTIERNAGRDPRRSVPRTDAVLGAPELAAAIRRLGHARVKEFVVAAQGRARLGDLTPSQEAVVAAVLADLPATAADVRPVLNATGVLLHTNLGRAPLSAAAIDALTVAAGTWDVELDLATGGRGRRGRGAIEALLAAVPSAAEAHLVNNGAAALALLALSASGLGPPDQPREVVISRGELVEIGDGFRIPDLLTAAGVRLREVGTTNRTHLADYEAAVGDATAFVLKVHPSNFVVRGFTAGCSVAQLSGLGVPVVVDIGSGLLRPHAALPDEPDAASVLDAGAAVVTASADKLLGGPQGGLLLGAPGPGAELVARARRHPLARAMRVDKLTLAAFEATLARADPTGPGGAGRRPRGVAEAGPRSRRVAGRGGSRRPRRGRGGDGRRGRRARGRAAQRRRRPARAVRRGVAGGPARGARPGRGRAVPARPAGPAARGGRRAVRARCSACTL